MRYCVVIIVAFVLGTIGTAMSANAPQQRVLFAPESFTANIGWWKKLTPRQKTAAVESMIAAEQYTYQIDAALAQVKLLQGKAPDDNNGATASTIEDLEFSKPIAVYVHQIDKYFGSHSHSPIVVPSILGCLADKPFPALTCHGALWK